MYSNERNYGFNFRDIISKLIFLILFVLLMMWLFPKVPNMLPFYNNVFRENIKYMQDTAKSYFTTDKLPQNVGETVELKLQDMIAKNLIIPFVDKDGNSCNVYSSYASVTKNANDYTLKINLSCNEETDYIVETLGCYDYCENDICTKEVEEEIQYQFKKCSTKEVESCSCPSGYIMKNGKCYKTISSSISAIPVFSSNSQYTYNAYVKEGETKQIEVDKIYLSGEITYSCSQGTLSTDGKHCIINANEGSSTSCKVVKTTGTYSGSEYDYIKTQFEYTCSNHIECPVQVPYNYYNKCTTEKTYSCSKVSLTTDGKHCSFGANETTSNGSYKCPDGATPVGSNENLKCYVSRKDADTYYCNAEDGLPINKKCYHFISGKFLYFDCPEDYDLDGSFCYITSSDTKNKVCKTLDKKVCSYKWSTSKAISGWTSTGKTRTVEKK